MYLRRAYRVRQGYVALLRRRAATTRRRHAIVLRLTRNRRRGVVKDRTISPGRGVRLRAQAFRRGHLRRVGRLFQVVLGRQRRTHGRLRAICFHALSIRVVNRRGRSTVVGHRPSDLPTRKGNLRRHARGDFNVGDRRYVGHSPGNFHLHLRRHPASGITHRARVTIERATRVGSRLFPVLRLRADIGAQLCRQVVVISLSRQWVGGTGHLVFHLSSS